MLTPNAHYRPSARFLALPDGDVFVPKVISSLAMGCPCGVMRPWFDFRFRRYIHREKELLLYKSLFTEENGRTQKHSSESINTNKAKTAKTATKSITVVDTWNYIIIILHQTWLFLRPTSYYKIGKSHSLWKCIVPCLFKITALNLSIRNVIWQNLVPILLLLVNIIIDVTYLICWIYNNFKRLLCKKCDVGYYAINRGVMNWCWQFQFHHYYTKFLTHTEIKYSES